ncbi:putative leucine-rich repeat domain, L domain-containing protein [Rosa chinensis]|uniref:Putative leucine-rich repeat domain, L domain-containing protein n=2 Tax=Rosa chinensis TaxID=74649 RepID=A0A2P6SHM1_ROSCH|nr:putative leucine-rich repeat domain, L domain-containing protein [Rosa chinensis]
MPLQPNYLTPYAIIFIFFISSVDCRSTACNKLDQDSLWSSFNMPSSPLNWSSDDCCQWEGITCDMSGRVARVSLPSKGLKGYILSSSSLRNLTHLTHLNLSHNSLTGSLDQTGFFLSLSHLEILDLSYNFLSGELPSSLSSVNIRMLDLSSNHFHGAIPSSFFQQAWNLTSFNVSNNMFTGSIPSSICTRSYPLIRLLDFSFNKFNGSISGGIGECSKLEVLRAGYNNLSGILPDDIYSASALEEIVLPHNSIYGFISERVVNLTNLRILDLYSNELSGALPTSIGKLSKLQFMLLHFNNLEGYLPPSLMNCTSIVELHLGSNHLEGNISTLNFSKLGQLTKLDLWMNYFTGILPLSLYSCKSLKAIRLSRNDLQGQIQPEIRSLKLLSFLSLGYTRLTNVTGALQILMGCKRLRALLLSSSFHLAEKLPADYGMVDFAGFQNLQFLDLSNCELMGQIPIWLSKLKKLEVLELSSNRITGSIPSWLGNLPRLFFLNLGSNLLSGEFPKEICRLPSLVSDQSTDQVDDYLELPIYGSKDAIILQYTLSYFPRAIDIKNNTFTGSIPVEIGELQLLHILHLSGNNFSGSIPEEISNLKNLEELDLSMNHFSGTIPQLLAALTFLKSFNASYNDFEGQIPIGTQLQSFSASAFEGNPKLCGAPLPNHCLPINDNDADKNSQYMESEQKFDWFHISVALGFITGFLGVFGPLYNQAWRYAYFNFLDNLWNRLYDHSLYC